MPCRCYAASAPHHASHATAPQVGPATAKRLASRGLETVDELLRAASADFPKSDAKKAVRPRTLHAARAHAARTLHAPAAHAHRAPLMRPSRSTLQVRAYCKRHLTGIVNPVNLAKLSAACERAELAARGEE